MKFISIILFLLNFTFTVESQQREITIPEIHFPAQTIKPITIPTRIIPQKTTPYGDIPEIVIPGLYIPELYIPAVDTKQNVIRIYDISFSDVVSLHKPRHPSQLRPIAGPSTLKRIENYMNTTFFAKKELTDLYCIIANDRTTSISWNQIELFQRYIFTHFKYLNNRTALTPDAFVSQSGGDCEDWALLTADFLRFWGYEAYIATFFDEISGHAICLVQANADTPKSYFRFSLMCQYTSTGDRIPDGEYIPIDYSFIGAFSPAIAAGMKLTAILNPSHMYNQIM